MWRLPAPSLRPDSSLAYPQHDSIDWDDFIGIIKAAKYTAYTSASLRQAFTVLDPDGDGELTREELQCGLELVGNNLSDDLADEMLAYADFCAEELLGTSYQSGDGKVMQNEFCR